MNLLPGIIDKRSISLPEKRCRAKLIRAHIAAGIAEVAALVGERTAGIIARIEGRAARLERVGQRIPAVIGQGAEQRVDGIAAVADQVARAGRAGAMVDAHQVLSLRLHRPVTIGDDCASAPVQVPGQEAVLGCQRARLTIQPAPIAGIVGVAIGDVVAE